MKGVYSTYIQFADFDGTENMLPDIQLGLIPQAGDLLSITYEQMHYMLEVEKVIHVIDCDRESVPDHGLTVNCELVSSRSTVKADAQT